MEKDLFEDFTTIRWVKWIKRKPTHNGMVIIKWNGKNISMGRIQNGELLALDEEKTKYRMEDKIRIVEYTESQKELMENMYWLEEIIDGEKYSEYTAKVIPFL